MKGSTKDIIEEQRQNKPVSKIPLLEPPSGGFFVPYSLYYGSAPTFVGLILAEAYFSPTYKEGREESHKFVSAMLENGMSYDLVSKISWLTKEQIVAIFLE